MWRTYWRFSYDYDFGNSWENTIQTAIHLAICEELPRCTAGGVACPPEGRRHVGLGHGDRIRLARTLRGLASDSDSQRFGLAAVNAELERVFSKRRQEVILKGQDGESERCTDNAHKRRCQI
jgi:Plasmid pRiA4b ORF-3-like protein